MATTMDAIRNGVDTEQLFGTLDAIRADSSLARFQFRARNRWIDGAHNRTTIRDFYAANQEDTSRAEEFVLDAGEPAILLVDRALALSGGSGYLNGSPLARAYRDVRAVPFMHPLGANRAYAFLGQLAAGREPSLHINN